MKKNIDIKVIAETAITICNAIIKITEILKKSSNKK
jgi:hypothetical protein